MAKFKIQNPKSKIGVLRLLALGVCAWAWFGACAWALSDMPSMPEDWYYTRALELPDARSIALGGVSVVSPSAFGFLANPALGVLRYDRFNAPSLPETQPRTTVGLAGQLGVVAEQRTRYVFDIYENAVGELAVADNLATSGRAGPIAVQYPLQQVTLGFGVLPKYDYTYHFRQELRDDFYQYLGLKELNVSGQVMRANLSAAYDIFEAVGAGIGLNYSFGNLNLDSTVNDTLRAIRREQPGGLGLTAGLLVHIGTAARFGLTFEPRPLVQAKAVDSTFTAVSDPMRVGVGANYFAPGRIPSAMYAQASYSDWHGLDSTLSSTLDIRAGVEHKLLDGLALRYGFGLLPSPRDPAIQTGLISLGVGMETNIGHLDFGGSLQRRAFGSELLTPEPSVNMRVYQTSWQVAVSVSRGF